MITVTRLGEFGHRRRRRWRVRRSIQIYSDSHWGRMNSKVEIIWFRASHAIFYNFGKTYTVWKISLLQVFEIFDIVLNPSPFLF